MVFNRSEGRKLTHYNKLQNFIRAKCFCLIVVFASVSLLFSENNTSFLLLKDINLRNGQMKIFSWNLFWVRQSTYAMIK